MIYIPIYTSVKLAMPKIEEKTGAEAAVSGPSLEKCTGWDRGSKSLVATGLGTVAASRTRVREMGKLMKNSSACF